MSKVETLTLELHGQVSKQKTCLTQSSPDLWRKKYHLSQKVMNGLENI
jgi:hypothetical protein